MRASESPLETSPFHPGEQAVQTQAGVRDEAEKRGQRMLTPELNPQQVTFFRQLPFLVSAHTDEDGQPWASLLTGPPGFVTIDEHTLQGAIALPPGGNPNRVSLRTGGDIGLLGIELSSHRRNRLNGTVFATADNRWRFLVEQGYGNCPKYITERPWPAEFFQRSYTLEAENGLSDSAAVLASKTDTFFIATASGPVHPRDTGTKSDTRPSAWGADASHRGGDPGFLQVEDGGLVFEDFPGNNMFNTLGNIAHYPPCGLLILDFDSGDMVQLAALGTIEHRDDGRTIKLEVAASRFWRAERQATH